MASRTAPTAVALFALLCALAVSAVSAQSAFAGLLVQPAVNATPAAAPVCQGTNPPQLVIQSLIPVAAPGKEPYIAVRNTGGQTANLTGFTLHTGEDPKSAPTPLRIPPSRQCTENSTIDAGAEVILTPRSESNPCGFEFTLGESGTLQLSDVSGARVSAVAWANATAGSSIVLLPDGTYKTLPPNVNVLDTLRGLGVYETFLAALRVANLEQALLAASDPNYTGPQLPQQDLVLNPQFPWWFGGVGVAPPPPPPPSPAPGPAPVGVPAQGPYTILAPTDDAFDALLTNLGGGRRLPRDALYRLPQLRDILLYHIVPGLYSSEYLRNNTPVFTAKGVEVVPFADGCMTSGKLMLHDSCIDKPTPDNFTCAEQRNFQKCDFPFITSPLAAQWQGGFCQRTCERCSCAPDSGVICAEVQTLDARASNGVVHGISRVLFPPPIFTKEAAIAQAIAYNASGNATYDANGIAIAPVQPAVLGGLPGAAVAPGAVAPDAVAPGAAVPPDATAASVDPGAATTTPPVTATGGAGARRLQ